MTRRIAIACAIGMMAYPLGFAANFVLIATQLPAMLLTALLVSLLGLPYEPLLTVWFAIVYLATLGVLVFSTVWQKSDLIVRNIAITACALLSMSVLLIAFWPHG